MTAMSKYALQIPCSNAHALNILSHNVDNAKSRSELRAYLADQHENQALLVLRVWWELQNIRDCSDRHSRGARAQALWEKYFVPTICSSLPPCCFACQTDNLISSSGTDLLKTVDDLKRECIKFVETRIKATASPRSITAIFDT